MLDNKPKRFRIVVKKVDEVFLVDDEENKPITEAVLFLSKKRLVFDLFIIEIESSREFVRLGVSELTYKKWGVAYPNPRIMSFLDEEGIYEFSIELKRFVRLPE